MAKKPPARSAAKTVRKPAPKQVRKPVPKPAAKSAPAARRKPESAEGLLLSLDRELVKLANRRAELTIQHLQSQADLRHAMFDPQAEQQLWERIDMGNNGPLTSAPLRSIFREIVSAARSKLKTLRVAYLGPAV